MPFLPVGGQAVIEGVMMRSPSRVAVAVRRMDGSLAFMERPFSSITRRVRALGLPVVRGAVSLFETLFLGISALNFSADGRIMGSIYDSGDRMISISATASPFFTASPGFLYQRTTFPSVIASPSAAWLIERAGFPRGVARRSPSPAAPAAGASARTAARRAWSSTRYPGLRRSTPRRDPASGASNL